jgi:hypothetical protein
MFLRAGPTAPESTAVSNNVEGHLKHTFAVLCCAEKSVCYNFLRAVDKRVEGLFGPPACEVPQVACFRALGRLAQLVRAPALQAGGRRFESCTAHQAVTQARGRSSVG